jgi:hypothetical protein
MPEAMRRCVFAVAVAGLAVVGAPRSAGAATRVWRGLSFNDPNWSNGLNWDGGVAPIAGDDLIFETQLPAVPATKFTPFNDFPPGTQFGSLTLSGLSTAVSGNRIYLTGHVTAETSHAEPAD